MSVRSRRQFIRDAALASAGIITAGPLATLVAGGCGRPRICPPPAGGQRVLADLHTHPMINAWNEHTPLGVKMPAVTRLARCALNTTKISFKHCHQAGIDMLCVAHFNAFDEWLSMPTDPNPEAPRATYRMLDALETELRGDSAPYAMIARSPLELARVLRTRRADPAFRVAVVHAIEGGHTLGGDVSVLDKLARRGVAMIGVTHFFNKGIASSANSFPFFPDQGALPPHRGLTEFGHEVIKRMHSLGMIVDITHATTTSIDDILRESTGPLVSTHSAAHTLGDHPYSLRDEHIQEISRRGGIVGVIFLPYWLSNYSNQHLAKGRGGLDEVVRTIRYIYKICGTHRCIGIGSDFSGYITGPNNMHYLSEIGKFRELLSREFDHDEKIVEEIMATNVIRFLRENWGKKVATNG